MADTTKRNWPEEPYSSVAFNRARSHGLKLVAWKPLKFWPTTQKGLRLLAYENIAEFVNRIRYRPCFRRPSIAVGNQPQSPPQGIQTSRDKPAAKIAGLSVGRRNTPKATSPEPTRVSSLGRLVCSSKRVGILCYTGSVFYVAAALKVRHRGFDSESPSSIQGTRLLAG